VKPDQQHSFWISYSDLATGLMMVFLLLMVMLWKQAQDEKKAAEANVRALVEETEHYLEDIEELAEHLTTGMKDRLVTGVEINSSTGQLTVRPEAVSFGTRETGLDDNDRTALQSFAPRYMCLLWYHEARELTFLDPQGRKTADEQREPADSEADADRPRPALIRRVEVTGHADMQGNSNVVVGKRKSPREPFPTALGLNSNQLYASSRAASVSGFISSLLRDCDEKGTCESLFAGKGTPDEYARMCASSSQRVWNYTQERLHVAGAGHIHQCLDALRRKADLPLGCEDPKGDSEDKSARLVNFSLRFRELDLSKQVVEISRPELGNARCRQKDGEMEFAHDQALRQLARQCMGTARDETDSSGIAPGGCSELRSLTEGYDCEGPCASVSPSCLETQ